MISILCRLLSVSINNQFILSKSTIVYFLKKKLTYISSALTMCKRWITEPTISRLAIVVLIQTLKKYNNNMSFTFNYFYSWLCSILHKIINILPKTIYAWKKILVGPMRKKMTGIQICILKGRPPLWSLIDIDIDIA